MAHHKSFVAHHKSLMAHHKPLMYHRKPLAQHKSLVTHCRKAWNQSTAAGGQHVNQQVLKAVMEANISLKRFGGADAVTQDKAAKLRTRGEELKKKCEAASSKLYSPSRVSSRMVCIVLPDRAK